MNNRGTIDKGTLLLMTAAAAWIGAVPVMAQTSEFVISFADIITLASFITTPPTLVMLAAWRHLGKRLTAVETADPCEEHVERLDDMDKLIDHTVELVGQLGEKIEHLEVKQQGRGLAG